MTGSDLLLAVVLDATLGDPRWLPHPVRLMGAAITWCEQRVRAICRSARSLRVAGVCLAAFIPLGAYGAGQFFIDQADRVSSLLGHCVSIGLAFTTLAWRDLLDHVSVIRREVANGNLVAARLAVAKVVGRDTDRLSEQEIVRATVETEAESLSDGVIAPLFYLTIGGAPLALAYKAVNTLDSMIGHRDARYEHLGWASARLDDALNWLPARLTSGIIAIAAGVATGQWRRVTESVRICRRDGHRHPSPNSGRPEAAMAGALSVQLGGLNYYDGQAQWRCPLGDNPRPLGLRDIDLTTRILMTGYAVAVALAVTALWLS